MPRLPYRFRTPPVRRISRALLIVLAAAAIAYVYERETFARGAERATGRIVDMIQVPSSSTGDSYELVVRFEHEGQPYHFTSGRSVFQQLSGNYETGNRVPVAYDPADPNEARLGDLFHVYPVFGTLLVLMGIVVGVAVFFIIRG
ncbi:MAG: DUF3592 domain-containing protein [Longimicrobiales bacterium]|nr:DUF3592 domain-containing protein [Longimicrobiales bacterium]